MCINGKLLINKPNNITSHDIIKNIKKKFTINKIGHCGTLDPMANGLIIICFGNNKNNIKKLVNKKKTYIVNAISGIKSNTNDIYGKIEFLEKNDIKINNIKIKYINKIIKKIHKQKPESFSSIKHNGKTFYKYARLNIKIKKNQRKIIIFKINIIKNVNNLITMKITCSKGTYIRSIIRFIGQKLNNPLCVLNITRLSSGKYQILNSYTLKEILNLNNKNELKTLIKN